MYRSKKSAESPLAGTSEKKRIGIAIVIRQNAEQAVAPPDSEGEHTDERETR